MNKFRNLPTIVKQNPGHMGRRIEVTQKELAYYQQQKILKDINFFESTVPYVTYFVIGVGFIFFSVYNYNLVYNKNKNVWKNFWLTLMDLEIEEGKATKTELKEK